MALGGLVATILRSVVIILLGSWMFNVQYTMINPLQLFAVFCLSMTSLYGMGMMLGSAFLLFGREAWAVAELVRGTGQSDFRLLLPDQVTAVLGGGSRFSHPAHARPGRHEATGLPNRLPTGFPHPEGRDWHPGYRECNLHRGSQIVVGLHREIGHPRGPPDRGEAVIDVNPSVSTRTSEMWRSFKGATWLGWQIKSNWTDPLLFAIYSVVRPIARAAILVIMYGVITNNNFADPLFPFIYLGNAFYSYVFAIMNGVSYAVIDDREHYKTLKYMYIAPINIPVYLLGRAASEFITASLSVIVSLVAGVLFLHVTFNFFDINWLLFLVTMLIGIPMLAMMGLILGAISLLIVRHSGFIADGVSGVLFLFSGAIYPLDVLPVWLRPIGFAIPITYWLELIRRSLIGNVANAFPTLARFSDLQLLGILAGLSLVFGVSAIFIFRACDRRAHGGLIDRTTNY